MKIVCLLLILLSVVFAENELLLDRIVELVESGHPKLAGTGLLKKVLHKADSDDIQQLCLHGCDVIRTARHLDCSVACHNLQKLLKVKEHHQGHIVQRRSWDDVWDFFKDEALETSGVLI